MGFRWLPKLSQDIFYLKQDDVLLTEPEDLANRLALDALEAALADLCPGEKLSVCQAKHRFRIEQ